MNSRNQTALNPFAVSEKENFPDIDEVLGAIGSKDGSEPVSLEEGSSFHDLPMLFTQSQMQQMKAAEHNLKACNREWWASRV